MSLENRVKQGIVAAVGTAAMTVLTAFRIAASREEEINPKGLALITALFSGAVGVLWSLMPRAVDPLTESVEAMKEEMAPTIKAAVQLATLEDTVEVRPVVPQTGYSRGYSKVRSINDDDLEDDEWKVDKEYPWEL